jgi:phosphoserine phosphatase
VAERKHTRAAFAPGSFFSGGNRDGLHRSGYPRHMGGPTLLRCFGKVAKDSAFFCGDSMSASPSIAAFFDIDGTLLAPPSLESRFIGYLLEQDKLSKSNVLRWMAYAGRSILYDPRRALGANKQYLAGLSASLVADWADSLGTGDSNPNLLEVFDEGLDRVRWHQSQHHRVFLVSGTPAPLARYFASLWPVKVEAVGTELAACFGAESCVHSLAVAAASGTPRTPEKNLRSSIWTGALAGEYMVGDAKRRTLQTSAMRHQLDLASCYAYGDSTDDRAMLEAVGHPAVVNPSRGLARIAEKRGWPMSRWVSIETAHGKTLTRSKIPGPLPKRASAEQPRS